MRFMLPVLGLWVVNALLEIDQTLARRRGRREGGGRVRSNNGCLTYTLLPSLARQVHDVW